MTILRKILGVFVMIAGIIGLLISLAGLVGLWLVRPTVSAAIDSTIATLVQSIETSQRAMDVTDQALGATVDSVDALSEMLNTTALSVEDTKPMLTRMNTVMGQQLPETLQAATSSLQSSQQAAASLESAIQSLDAFRTMMSAMPLLSAFVPDDQQQYNPEISMAESLGEVAASLEEMPATFVQMSDDLAKADDHLDDIQSNLVTMSKSVALISANLREYQAMIGQSKASMKKIKTMFVKVQNNLQTILTSITVVLALLLFWMLAAQVVILSQGWELFQGTAGRMEGGAARVVEEPALVEEPVGSAASEPDSQPEAAQEAEAVEKEDSAPANPAE